MKAADIADRRLIEAIWHINWAKEPGIYRWALIWDLEEELPEFPTKVIRAKCRALIRRGLIDGCDCGCRGDFELTAAGRAVLGVSESP